MYLAINPKSSEYADFVKYIAPEKYTFNQNVRGMAFIEGELIKAEPAPPRQFTTVRITHIADDLWKLLESPSVGEDWHAVFTCSYVHNEPVLIGHAIDRHAYTTYKQRVVDIWGDDLSKHDPRSYVELITDTEIPPENVRAYIGRRGVQGYTPEFLESLKEMMDKLAIACDNKEYAYYSRYQDRWCRGACGNRRCVVQVLSPEWLSKLPVRPPESGWSMEDWLNGKRLPRPKIQSVVDTHPLAQYLLYISDVDVRCDSRFDNKRVFDFITVTWSLPTFGDRAEIRRTLTENRREVFKYTLDILAEHKKFKKYNVPVGILKVAHASYQGNSLHITFEVKQTPSTMDFIKAEGK